MPSAPATTFASSPSGPLSRRVVLGLAVAALAIPAAAPRAAAVTGVRSTSVGVLNAIPAAAGALAATGVNAVTLQVGWDSAQPAKGGPLNPYYVAELRQAYQKYRAQGLQVVLDPGLQYAPAWVFDLPGSRFVNQYGHAFVDSTPSGQNVPDAVWNTSVRAAQSGYLRLLSAALGRDSFSAVRAGGLLTGELRYPGGDYAGRSGSWWAFSAGAQRTSPVPGYKPGISPRDRTKEAAFLRFYLDSLAGYQNFLNGAIATSFSGDVHFMYPSYGVRPGDEQRALAAGLDRDVLRRCELIQGVDFARLVRRLPGYQAGRTGGGRVIAYTTWLDGPEFGTADADVSPVEYLARLAAGSTVVLGGENTESSAVDPRAVALCRARAQRFGLVTIMWFNSHAGPTSLLTQLSGTSV